MVRRLLGAFNKEVRGLHEAAYLLALFALFSQLLALVRDRLLAESFGAGVELDIYFSAFRIPDIIFATVASFISVYVLIPFLSDRLERSIAEAQRYLSRIFSAFFVLLILASGVFFFALPFLVDLFFSGLSEGARGQIIVLSRIMLIQPVLLGISSLLASVTQTLRRFSLFALTPLLYNGGIIFGILVLYPKLGLPGLAWGVVLGALLHLLIQVPLLLRQKLLPFFTTRISFSELKSLILVSLPRTAGLTILQVVLLILVSLAARMEEGSVAIFNLSYNLQFVPISIIGVSYSVAVFPTLARLISSGDEGAFYAQVSTAARHILFWSFPTIALFIVLRAQIVRTILGSGSFDWPDTRLTAAAAALFVLSLAAYSLVLLLVRAYYAAGKTITPVLINVIFSSLAIAFAFLFVYLFEHSERWKFFIESLLRIDGITGTKIVMLPLGYSVALLLNAAVLLAFFQKDFTKLTGSLMRSAAQSFTAAVVMGAVAHEMLNVFDDIFDVQTLLGIFLQGLLSGVIGIVIGVLLLRLMGNKELSETAGTLNKKIFRVRPIAPDRPDGE